MVTEFIKQILSDICLDERIKDGTFNIQDKTHLGILKEYVTEAVDGEFAHALLEHLIKVDEGNFPERQAYNKDGILVTFPDPESKKAAIARGTHSENAPTGTQTTDTPSAPQEPDTSTTPATTPDEDESSSEASDDSDDESPDPESIFSDFEDPQAVVADKEAAMGDTLHVDVSADDIKLRDTGQEDEIGLKPGESRPTNKEVIHVYDALEAVKKSKLDDNVPDISFDSLVATGELHPTILFALKQKWEYDKSGRWFDETNKFRAVTDRRGQLDPASVEDKDEMLLWLDDYLKRRRGAD